ncbi:MAG: phage Gp37/Gp68 family protein [Anaerolineaceae bacterium]
MSQNSSIEWTESTWNPITGCTKISIGCTNCYAERMARRLQAMGQPNYINGFNITLHPNSLNLPLKWKKPQMIFVNSMSDLFHDEVPFEFIQEIFNVMKNAYWHTFQILTKRSERLLEIDKYIAWPPNVWMGVSIENNKFIYRCEHLRKTKSKIKFLSCEPLLGPIKDLNLKGIHWVIVGGESGTNARPVKEDWICEIRDQCISNNIPFYFKQWGGKNRKKSGRILQGQIWNQMPIYSANLE